MSRPARVIVDVNAVRANFDVVRQTAPSAQVMAIVKADGYGHGIARIASALADRADAFGVASIEEAVQLREAGVGSKIVLLEGPFGADEMDDISSYKLDTVIHSREQATLLAHADPDIAVWLKIDTGMHRLGFAPAEVNSVLEQLSGMSRTIRFVTHFASSHQPNDPSVTQQMEVFDAVLADRGGERSVANSGAIMAWPEYHSDWVRPGLMLYGVSPFSGSFGRDHGLQPAMTVASALISVREVEAGGSVGYGKGYICPENMPVGVVAFGYGDGYPRRATTGTPIVVGGKRTQVIGEASMDMLTVDLRPIPSAAVGDPVVLWGPELPVEEVAKSAGTIPYELLCRVRMRARYVEAGE